MATLIIVQLLCYFDAGVVELVDTHDSKSCGAIRESSSLSSGTRGKNDCRDYRLDRDGFDFGGVFSCQYGAAEAQG